MASQVELLRELRDKTGAGIMECKKALEATKGDLEAAVNFLREQGVFQAEKKQSRSTREGIIESYIHLGRKLGVLVEVNCETDFVARTDEFRQLAREIAMQIAASNPLVVSRKDLTSEVIEREKGIYRAQALSLGKPESMVEEMVEKKMEKFFSEVCLLEQPYIKDMDKNIETLIKEHIAKFGENITVKRFTRFRVGE